MRFGFRLPYFLLSQFVLLPKLLHLKILLFFIACNQ
nr:MAG TPA: hypothetical protein [Caudoviricetes sp.]DAW71657.1 MAG TPA: hypothetical protein [Caudoviricetes sp.]